MGMARVVASGGVDDETHAYIQPGDVMVPVPDAAELRAELRDEIAALRTALADAVAVGQAEFIRGRVEGQAEANGVLLLAIGERDSLIVERKSLHARECEVVERLAASLIKVSALEEENAGLRKGGASAAAVTDLRFELEQAERDRISLVNDAQALIRQLAASASRVALLEVEKAELIETEADIGSLAAAQCAYFASRMARSDRQMDRLRAEIEGLRKR
jgi:hypothetical protein